MATKFGRFRDFGEWACRKGEGRFFKGCLKLKLVPAYAGSFGAAARRGWAVCLYKKDSGSRVRQLTETGRLPQVTWPGQRLARLIAVVLLLYLSSLHRRPLLPACTSPFASTPVLQGCTTTIMRLMAAACFITYGTCLCSAASVSGQVGRSVS